MSHLSQRLALKDYCNMPALQHTASVTVIKTEDRCDTCPYTTRSDVLIAKQVLPAEVRIEQFAATVPFKK